MTHRIKIALCLFLSAAALALPEPAALVRASQSPATSAEETQAPAPSPLTDTFWLARSGAAGEQVFASPARVAAINENIRARDPQSVNLANYPANLPGSAVRSAILTAAADALDDELWTMGRPVTDGERDAARRSLTLERLPDTAAVRRAVTLRRADLRALPISTAWYEDDDPFQDDILQGTAVDPGEPVAVLAENGDGWCFVQTRNYRGWLPAAALAFADDHDWALFTNPEHFLVVTASLVSVDLPENAPVSSTPPSGGVPRSQKTAPVAAGPSPAAPPLLFQMGSRLPLIKSTKKTWDVIVPTAKNGRLVPCTITLARDEGNFHEGWLPATTNTLIRQAFRFLGAPYGWGGLENSVDCSSFAADIYRTIGIELPRDADVQEAVMEPRWALEDKGGAERYAVFSHVPPGSLLFLPGHVMMYLGLDDSGDPLVIHALSRYNAFSPDRKTITSQPVRRVIVSGLSLPLASGRTFFEGLTAAGTMR